MPTYENWERLRKLGTIAGTIAKKMLYLSYYFMFCKL